MRVRVFWSRPLDKGAAKSFSGSYYLKMMRLSIGGGKSSDYRSATANFL